ncbi:MAG: type II secretion system major pseudopilin GspG [Pseudomonadota bacterium]
MQVSQMLHRQAQRGFTLIEIIVVVVIIGILAGVVGPKIFGNVYKAQKTRIKLDIQNIEAALKIYRLDNFTYPTNEHGGLKALVEKPADPNLTNYDPEGYLAELPKDPWNRPYIYVYPGQRGDFDVYTLGEDGRVGGEGSNTDLWNNDI